MDKGSWWDSPWAYRESEMTEKLNNNSNHTQEYKDNDKDPWGLMTLSKSSIE